MTSLASCFLSHSFITIIKPIVPTCLFSNFQNENRLQHLLWGTQEQMLTVQTHSSTDYKVWSNPEPLNTFFTLSKYENQMFSTLQKKKVTRWEKHNPENVLVSWLEGNILEKCFTRLPVSMMQLLPHGHYPYHLMRRDSQDGGQSAGSWCVW